MKISHAIRKSRYYNEDRIIFGESFAMVCDGATALHKSCVRPSDGSWLVSYIKKNLDKAATDVRGQLKKIAASAYGEFAKLTGGLGDELCLPSAGLAWAELHGQRVAIYTIGDCEAAIIKRDGSKIRHVIPSLPRLDNIALEHIKIKAAEQGVSVRQATRLCNDVLIKHRRLMNKSGGYPVFTVDKNPSCEFLANEYDVAELSEVYLYTDGITQAFDELCIYPSWQDMFSRSIDLQEEIQKIVTRAYQDKECNAYPRFKTIDDIAAIKIEF